MSYSFTSKTKFRLCDSACANQHAHNRSDCEGQPAHLRRIFTGRSMARYLYGYSYADSDDSNQTVCHGCAG